MHHSTRRQVLAGITAPAGAATRAFLTRAMALAMTAMAASLPATAQTAGRNFGSTLPSTIGQMSGHAPFTGDKIADDGTVSAGTYHDFVTTECVGSLTDGESLKKVFFIYNEGAQKFLCPGGYWGNHAGLSDVPHPFWLQERTENTADQYVKYPYAKGETKEYESIMSDLWALTTIQVGSVEGKGRSNATYNTLQRVYTTGTGTATSSLKPAGTWTKGTAFSKETAVNFANGDRIEADIDLSGCTGTTIGSTFYPENVLSIGNNIKDWSSKAGQYNLHLYYNPNTKVLEIQYVSAGWTDSRKLYQTITGNKLELTLQKGALTINGEQYFLNVKVGYAEGHEGETVYFKKDSNGNYATDATGSIIADASLDAGTGLAYKYNDYIYATANTADGTRTFFLSSRIIKHDGSYAGEGKYLAFAPKDKSISDVNPADVGLYVDRNINRWNGLAIDNSLEAMRKASEWHIEYIDGTDNLCHLYLDMPFDKDGNVTDENTKYYLQTSPYYVQGVARGTSAGSTVKNVYYPFDYADGRTPTGMYDDESESADQADVFTTILQGKNAQWKIVSVYDYFNMAYTVSAEMEDPTDVSFMVLDHSFSRENGQLSEWKAEATLTSTPDEVAAGKAKMRIGIDRYYKVATGDSQYYNEKGQQYGINGVKVDNTELRIHSRYTGVCVSRGGHGRFCQKVNVYKAGWYKVTCKGMTNVGARMFVESGQKSASSKLGAISDAHLSQLGISNADNVYWPFDVSRPIYNSTVLMSDPNIKQDDKDKYDYTRQLLVYVDNASMSAPATITLGIDVPQSDRDADTQWTVFDDFRLYYGGQTSDAYLVLDEDNTSLDYLDLTKDTYENRTLCLNRTFKLNKWNSIVLPVGLTREQFEGAFGTDAKLARLYELTDTQIRFLNVTATTTNDINGKSYWMQPNTPYIIYPTQAGTETKYTTTLRKWDTTDGESLTVTAPAGHYKIPGVTLDPAIVPSTTDESTATHWNFGGEKVDISGTSYPYIVKADAVGSNGTMTAYGMLCANYYMEDGSKKPVAGAYMMPNAYVVSGNKLTKLGTAGGASKGFRCWFDYTEASLQTAVPQMFIDGVSDTTTGISDITEADASPWPTVGKFAGAVYSIDGQMIRRGTSTDGLGKGLYIINGRKVLVN